MATNALFGPAGNCEAFYAAGNKHTVQIFPWLQQQGLTAYEYQCGRGVRLSASSAEAMRAEAAKCGITMSLHAPYFISLASAEAEKRDNSINYILDSARAVTMLGGDRIVVHPGGLGGRSREEATALATETLLRAQAALDAEGLSHVHICPEVMGKINQLGTLEEVLTQAGADITLDQLSESLEISEMFLMERVEDTELFYVYVTWDEPAMAEKIAILIRWMNSPPTLHQLVRR